VSSSDPHPGLDRLARVTFAAESPVRRFVSSGRLNPLPHAGTISIVLFIVVVVTGIYITLFFEFGFEASYRSVEKLTAHPIQRFMRSLHRYSSAALVLTTLVHGWRIFVAARFNGPRRWRWLTGWTAVLIVFITGVTGYWLLWDERAQLINEATASVLGVFDVGTAVVTAILTAEGSGWPVLLVIWFSHLLTTTVIGYFLWRHLRRSKLPWLPPRLWTGLMVGALVLVSLAFPVELLGAADPSVLVDDVPIDPFFLFLLPGLTRLPGLAVMGVFAAVSLFVAVVPWILDRGRKEVVSIDPVACTGCELCVVDCPYYALKMVEVAERRIAEVDASACVACGICVGSCVFDAIALPGATVPDDIDVIGRSVVLVCDQHRRLRSGDDADLIAVRCAGVISPTALNGLLNAGAESVQVIGCAPGECVFGVGNQLAEQRMSGKRRPRLPIRSAEHATRDFVAPSALTHAIATPGTHLSADPADIPTNRARLALAGAVVAMSILLVGLATTVVLTVDRPESGVLVVVHHEPGSVIAGEETPSGSPGTETRLLTRIGDQGVVSRSVGDGGLVSAVVDIPARNGETYVGVEMIEGEDRTVIHDEVVDLKAGQRLVLEIKDEVDTGVEAGREVFSSSSAGCQVCHSLEPGVEIVGPSLANIGADASSRIPGVSAEGYLRESILEPDAYVLEGYPAGQMLDVYEETLTEQEIDALITYLMSLQEEN
jgi:ferredoxin/mono/diheme cytochrome c family protein